MTQFPKQKLTGVTPHDWQGLPGPAGPNGMSIVGLPGKDGLPGYDGRDGVKGDKGDRGLTWRGMWQPDIPYAVDDAVLYKGDLWFSLEQNRNQTPYKGSPCWFFVLSGDKQGPGGGSGPKGDPGESIVGPAGPKGDRGEPGYPWDDEFTISSWQIGQEGQPGHLYVYKAVLYFTTEATKIRPPASPWQRLRLPGSCRRCLVAMPAQRLCS